LSCADNGGTSSRILPNEDLHLLLPAPDVRLSLSLSLSVVYLTTVELLATREAICFVITGEQ